MIRGACWLVVALTAVSGVAGDGHVVSRGCFVLTLGRDTTSIECFRQTATRLEVEQVDRAGSVVRRHFAYDFANDDVTRATLVVTAPGNPVPVMTWEATFAGDSVKARLEQGSQPPRDVRGAVPAGSIVVSYNCPWAVYETAIERLVRTGADSLRLPLHPIGASGTTWLSLHRLGRDSVDLLNHHQDHFHVRIDAAGRVLGAARSPVLARSS